MNKYHIKDDGNPGLCKADEGKCPKGGAHFDTEAEAREAVEKLFGSAVPVAAAKKEATSVPVYTRDGIRGHFAGLFTKDGRLTYEAGNHPLLTEEDTYNDLKKVFTLLTTNRLDVKRQNGKVREELTAIIDNTYRARTLAEDDDRRLRAAASLATLMPILTKHYEIKDPRSLEQAQADKRYLDGYRSESSALGQQARWGARYSLAPYSDEDVRTIEGIGNKIGGDVSKLDDSDIDTLARLNYAGNQTPDKWKDRKHIPQPTAVERYREAQAVEKLAASVPEEAKGLLQYSASPEGIAKTKVEALTQLTSIRVPKDSGYPGEVSHNIFNVAESTLNIRARNEELQKRVLEA